MTTYTIPGSIDDTGATDVTAEIVDWLTNTVVDGTAGSPNTVEFGTDKTYRIDGTYTQATIELIDRAHLIIDGNGSTFRTDTYTYPPDGSISKRRHWQFIRCDDIVVQNVKVYGGSIGGLGDSAYDTKLEFEHGFALWSCTNMQVTLCEVSHVWGDCVYTGVDGGGVCDGIEIDNCYLGDAGRQCFGLVAGHNLDIHDNTTGDIRRSIIDIEPNGANYTADNINVYDNAFGDRRLSFIASKGFPGVAQNITIENNTITGNLIGAIDPPGFGLRKNWIIRDNVASGFAGTPSRCVLDIRKVDGITITGNTQPMQADRDMHMARFTDCTGIVCSGNIIEPNGVGQFFEVTTVTPGSDPTSNAVSESSAVVAASMIAGIGSETCTLPTGSQAGDEIIAWVAHNGTSFASLMDAAGWMILGEVETNPWDTDVWYAAGQRTLTADDITAGEFTFTFNEGGVDWRTAVVLVTVRPLEGLESVSAIEQVAGTENSADVVASGVTTATAGALVIYLVGQDAGNGGLTAPDDVNDLGSVNTSSGIGVKAGAGWKIYTGAGTGGEKRFSAAATKIGGSITIAFPGRLLSRGLIAGSLGGSKIALSAYSKSELAP